MQVLLGQAERGLYKQENTETFNTILSCYRHRRSIVNQMQSCVVDSNMGSIPKYKITPLSIMLTE